MFIVHQALLLLVLATTPISAALIEREISEDIQNNRYEHLVRLIGSRDGKKITLSELVRIAKKEQSKPLLNAIIATRKIKKIHNTVARNRRELLQTSLFIETLLPKYTEKNIYYLPKEKTGLRHSVEYDPEYDTRFIVLEGKEAFIGKGVFKTVHKAILYEKSHPKVVARAVERTEHPHELHITKLLHNAPGIFKTRGFGRYQRRGKSYSTIYSKLYLAGSLQNVLDKGVRLSLYEKMKVARGLLSGLKSLHTRGVVHRDLGARNYLVDIAKGKFGKRKICASIADLGMAMYVQDAVNVKVQGNTFYTAPEGLFRKKMKGKHYYKTDIFAMGCVLYRLFYGKKAPWQFISYVKDTKRSPGCRFRELRSRIKKATHTRRRVLANYSRLTPKQEFELLILQMCHPVSSKRGAASDLSGWMDEIVKRKRLHKAVQAS